jgi:drug/metabolite transporter (DMT)-like permease
MTVTLRKYRGVDLVPAMCVGGLLVFLGIPLVRGLPPVPADLPLILVMGVVQLAVPVVLYVRAARHVPAMQMALISLLDAPLNPFWAWLGVGEVPAASALVGGAIIAAAVVLVVAGRRRAAPAPAASCAADP